MNPPPEPKKEITAKASVLEGAKIHLLHEFNRPYYYGIDALCDGSSENAEQFLHLAGRIVSASEAKIIRGTTGVLSAQYQDRLLRDRARDIVRQWAFPKYAEVKRLCDHIADQCLEKSLEPNAPCGGGAYAFGILQEEFASLSSGHPYLAQILKFGIAYNALSVKPYHGTKNKIWTLIELSGPVLISNGLTFARGGFLERGIDDLLTPLKGNADAR